MFDEMHFLFSVDPNIKNSKNAAMANQVVNAANPAQSSYYKNEMDDVNQNWKLNNYVVNKGDMDNYIQTDINKFYTKNNPYIELLSFCDGIQSSPALELKSSDFAYLRDIGVMPLNRLMILRRFPEGTNPPTDLSNFRSKPISVVIGWVKKDSDLLNFSFNERWEATTTQLHELLADIIKATFGIDITSILPIPGWGIGFMFQILQNMGITNPQYGDNGKVLPFGNPNLLKAGLTRPHESYGLESTFTFELETVYEQKYIAGIDPTVSTMEIIQNLLDMGTSDVDVLGQISSKLKNLLLHAANDPLSVNAWTTLATKFVEGFAKAMKNTIQMFKEDAEGIMNALKSTADLEDKSKRQIKNEDDAQAAQNKKEEQAGVAKWSEKVKVMETLGGALEESKLMKTILASTLARYQWPIRGSVSIFTGEANTPWHLTIGNPYAPLLSMNHIYVTSVGVTLGKEMAQNDIPKTITAKITMSQERSLGKQEIFSFFGVAYKRKYTKVEVKNDSSNTKKDDKSTRKEFVTPNKVTVNTLNTIDSFTLRR